MKFGFMATAETYKKQAPGILKLNIYFFKNQFSPEFLLEIQWIST